MRGYPTASVVVVGYRSRPYIERCFRSLLNQDYPGEFEILFVDNASDDGSVPFVRSRFPSVRVIESGTNSGYAAGNNLGASEAVGQVLAFVNPDTEAAPNWLHALVRPLTEDPSVGLTTSKIVLMDQPDVINTCGNDISLTGITTCRRAGECAADVVDDEEVAAVSGAACAIRARLFHGLGGFDERFWMYLEDTDLSWRVRAAGFRCLLAARSVVAHDYRFSLSPRKTRSIERNRYLMLASNLSLRSWLAVAPSLLVGEILTWGWALCHGPRFVWAKLLAVVSLLGCLVSLRAARRRRRAWRRVPESLLLAQHQAPLPIAEIANGALGRVAAACFAPLIATATLFALGVLAREPLAPTDAVEERYSPALEAAATGGNGGAD